MPIVTINLIIPPFSKEMNSRYIALDLDNYTATFLKQKVLSEELFSSNEYEVYFCELKKFLALNHLYRDEPCSMVNKRIDSLWHQFILFTRQYHAFCSRYFGKFVHHNPSLDYGNEGEIDSEEKIGAENFFRLYFMTFGTPHDLWFSDDF